MNMSQLLMQFLSGLVAGLAVMLLSYAQDQKDFLSIDCGLEQDSYTEASITFSPDTNFIDTGERKTISNPMQQYQSVRSFPEGTRNCYKIPIESGKKYLIRASFLYGNYDGKDSPPEFELHLGANLWHSVKMADVSYDYYVTKELIHIPMRNYIHVCLVNVNKGVPFISTIELRPLPDECYQTVHGSLALLWRHDFGRQTKKLYRYPSDVYDRIWYDVFDLPWGEISTPFVVEDQTGNRLPSDVMRTAATPTDDLSKYLNLQVPLRRVGKSAAYYIYLYFAEVEKATSSSPRELTIKMDEELISGPFVPEYLKTTTINTAFTSLGGWKSFSISASSRPILNAIEGYMATEFSVLETNLQDVEAITNVKTAYKIIRNWQGDPCNPQEYLWEGVQCSYSDDSRIISLDLSSSGLTGEIADSIANLKMIQTLDLSNNKLSGVLPEYLSQLSKLNVLNLEKNEFIGSVPEELIAKTKDGLSLSLCSNPSLSGQVPCKKKKKNKQFVIYAVGSMIVLLLVSSIPAATIYIWWKRKNNRGTYDVFLSFRGEDTRNTVIGHLRKALEAARITPFLDEDDLRVGDQIKPALLAAIEASKVAIIIFSETYVSSCWCLDELVKILECQQYKKLVVFPFFYKVEPTEVRHQSGHFVLDELVHHKYKEKIPRWTEALKEVANIAGKTYNQGSESIMIDDIVKVISEIVKKQEK